MPFASRKQDRFAHTPKGVKSFGGPATVEEFDAATDYSKLPEQAEGVLSKSFRSRAKAAKPGPGVLGKRFQK